MTPRPHADDPTTTDGLLPVPADAAARAALTARVTTLNDLRHPHLIPLARVTTLDDGHVRVTHARGETTDLAGVLAVRGHLSPAEAAAVGVHVAQALAVLHGAGHAHGPVEPADVVLRPGGEPALRPRPALPPEEWTPAEDVRAVARLVDALLGSRPAPGTPPGRHDGDPVTDPAGALRAALADALAADHRRRPEAGTLAAVIDAACTPSSLRLPDPATLAGAALAGVLRSQPTTADGQGVARRTRVARRGGAGTGTSPDAARGRVAGRTDQGTGRERTRAGSRRVGLARLAVVRPALRPALVAVGVCLAVGLTAGAVLELRDRRPGADAGETGPSAPTAEPARTGPAASPSPPSGQAVPVEAAEPSTPPAPTEPSAPAEPADSVPGDVVRDATRPEEAAVVLTQRRLDLLSRPTPDLATVDLVGSPAYEADTALVARLAESGVRPEGPRATLHRDPETVTTGTDPVRAQVRLEYVVEAHDQVGADGTRTAVPASGPQTATLELTWTDDGWRVSAVS